MIIAHILVWIITFFLGFYTFLWILRPIILKFKEVNSASKMAQIIVDLIIIAINVGYVLLIYYKFNNTIWTCIGSYVVSLIAVINDLRKEKQARMVATLLNPFNAEGGKDRP